MTQAETAQQNHVWRFFRAGGFDQVRLDSGDDIAALATLDQKLWVALACPTHGIEFDERTLDLIDVDHDGRVRAPDLLAAAEWAVGLLKKPNDLTLGRATLPLDAIADGAPEGQEILESARTILGVLGKGAAREITIADTAAIERIYDATAFNGDGVIPVEAAEDEATRAALGEIINVIGAVADRSGRPGVSQATSDRFFTEAEAYARWQDEAEAQAASILLLGERTEEAAATLAALDAKLADYFTRCRLAQYDPRAAEPLNPPLAAYEALAAQAIAPADAEVAGLPLARIEAGRPLSLKEGINPAWAEGVERFRQAVVVPLLGERDSLSEEAWQALKARFAEFHAWLARKPATAVEPLGIARIRALVSSELRRRIDALIARDIALEPQMNAISRVEKLTRLQRDLLPLLRNFVSFRDFYTRHEKAAFQAGRLYLDGRCCELCVTVEDEAKHAQLATLSRIYLAYCRCTRQGQKEPMTIAAAFTAGGSDNLMVGRNGVFYDRKGRDWDATIVKIISHPISVRQAFWLPYQQFGRMVGEGVQKVAAARSQASQAQMVRGAAQATAPAAGGATPPAQPQSQGYDAARMAGIFAAIGLAIGAIGTAIATIVTGFMGLSWWQMPLAILGVILLISGPSVVIAMLKLRQRNLGPILDACGWAVNARLKINIPFGRSLTSLAQLPPRAERSLTDPYAQKRQPWGLYIFVLILAAVIGALWKTGLIARWLGG
ncbi:MAG TPA: hypothetical protein VN832_03995 [Stellaceae bacterium]|nr:hypothetical protein [Stellaceae bacterium]